VYLEHVLNLQSTSDGLIHRPKAEWTISYVNSELNETEIWLQSCLQQEVSNEVKRDRFLFYSPKSTCMIVSIFKDLCACLMFCFIYF